MIAGEGTSDQAPARLFAYREPVLFQKLMDLLVDASVEYLAGQISAGADAVQLFDTWAGVLPPDEFYRWCIVPAQKIVAGLRAKVPNAKVIGFPRGVGTNLARYVDEVPVDAVGLDWMVDLNFARDHVQKKRAGAGKSRSAGVTRRRRSTRPQCRCDPGRALRRAADLQSRSRHFAGHADRACRADDQARAGLASKCDLLRD